MNDSSFEAMAQEIDGLLGIDQAKHADWHADSIAVRGYEGIDARTGSISYPLYQSATFAHPAWGRIDRLLLFALRQPHAPGA